MATNIIMTRFYPEYAGLAFFLGGESQTAVFYALSDADKPLSIRQIHYRVRHTYRPDIAYTTVATIANRLVEKGVLKRLSGKNQRDHRYCITVTEAQIVHAGITIIVERISEYQDIFNAVLKQHTELTHVQ